MQTSLPLAGAAVFSPALFLQVTMQDPLDPDRHYIVRIEDGSNNTLAAKDFVVTRALNVSSVEAISSTKARVYFSENIDERDVLDNINFKLYKAEATSPPDTEITLDGPRPAGVAIDPGYQSVTLTADGTTLDPSVIYRVSVDTPDNVYS